MQAARLGRLEIARCLLQAGAAPDILVEDHCRGGDPEVVGRSALFFALVKGDEDLVELLEPVTHTSIRALAYRELPKHLQWLAENPPPHMPTVHLFMASQNKRPDRLREAIAAGGEVNHRLPRGACNRLSGGTPLSFAAATGRMDLVGPLLEAGADPGLAGLDGRTPADIAALNGHPELAEMLRAASQPPSTPDLR